MALHFVIGFRDLGGDSEVESIYVGKDAEKARGAAANYQGAKTLWVRNPQGVWKTNDELARVRDQQKLAVEIAALNAAPPMSAAEKVSAQKDFEIARLTRENERLKDQVVSEADAAAAADVAAKQAELDLQEKLKADADAKRKQDEADAAVAESVKLAEDRVAAEEAAGLDPEEEERKKAARAQADAAKKIEEEQAAKAEAEKAEAERLAEMKKDSTHAADGKDGDVKPAQKGSPARGKK